MLPTECNWHLHRYLWVEPLEYKERQKVLDGFNKMIRSLDQKPLYLRRDLGAEFVNHLFRQYCQNEGIIKINPFSHGKAVYIERLNQSIQKLLHGHLLETGTKNFLSILDLVVKTCNTQAHCMLGNKSPQWAENNPNSSYLASVNKKYMDSFLKYQRKPKFKIGDRVRIKKQKNIFEKYYDANFSVSFLA